MQIEFSSIVAAVLLMTVITLALLSRRQQRMGTTGLDRALVKEHGKLKDRMAAVEAQLSSCATKADMAALSGKIDALEEHSASAGDINALEGKVNAALVKIEAVEKAADRTEAGVSRIEGYLMQRGIDR